MLQAFPFLCLDTPLQLESLFLPMCHIDTDAWKVSYEFVKSVANKVPKYRMNDGAKEITNAGTEEDTMLADKT